MELRDKLNTLDGYSTRLEELKEYIEKRENDIANIEEYEKKGIQLHTLPNQQVIQNKRKAILDYKTIALITSYSMGEDIEKVYTQYFSIIPHMENNWKKDGGYIDMVWMLSIGIMLEIEYDMFIKLSDIVKRDDPNDFLIDNLINYRNPLWGIKSDKFMSKIPYQATKEIISLTKVDKENALNQLKKYLTKEWYKGHSSASWHNSHKHGIIHFGYWSFESGALVKILGLDDSSLKDTQYYPYDMVHWKD